RPSSWANCLRVTGIKGSPRLKFQHDDARKWAMALLPAREQRTDRQAFSSTDISLIADAWGFNQNHTKDAVLSQVQCPHNPMATRYADDDDDDDCGLSERDDPQESDQDPGEYDDEVEEVPCPYCGEPVYEQAEICPHCRSYVSREDAPRRPVPRWIWVGV